MNPMTKKEPIKDGPYESFYKNGQLKFSGNYKYGKRDGLREWFHENSQLKTRENFKNGKLDLREYFDEENYRNGKLDGLYEYY